MRIVGFVPALRDRDRAFAEGLRRLGGHIASYRGLLAMNRIRNLFDRSAEPDHHAVFHAFAEGLARVIARRRPGAARVRAVEG